MRWWVAIGVEGKGFHHLLTKHFSPFLSHSHYPYDIQKKTPYPCSAVTQTGWLEDGQMVAHPLPWLGQGSHAHSIHCSCYSVTSGAFGLDPGVSDEHRADDSHLLGWWISLPCLLTLPLCISEAGTGIVVVSQQEQMKPQKESGFWTVNQRNQNQSPDDITPKAHVSTGLSS